MPQEILKATEAPEWIYQLFSEIDTLAFGPGFARLNEQTVMQFGTALITGVSAIRAFFEKIDSPLEITHRIHDFWDGGRTKILRGDAVLRRKGSGDSFVTTPLMQIFYMADQREELERWFIVNGPIKTDAVL